MISFGACFPFPAPRRRRLQPETVLDAVKDARVSVERKAFRAEIVVIVCLSRAEKMET